MRDILDELEDIEATMESEEEKYKREIASLKEEQQQKNGKAETKTEN